MQHLRFLLAQLKLLGAAHLCLPLLEQAEIRTEEDADIIIGILTDVLPDLEQLSMEVHLETSLDPATYASFLTRIAQPRICVTYDTGNSASLGYNPQEEFAAYGERIGSVHIKDRKRAGPTVRLGTGDTDFVRVAEELRKRSFTGLFTLEAARGEPGLEVPLLREYRSFAERVFVN